MEDSSIYSILCISPNQEVDLIADMIDMKCDQENASTSLALLPFECRIRKR
jgi:hypothetical protein